MNNFEYQIKKNGIKGLPLEFDEFNFLIVYLFQKRILRSDQISSMVSNICDYCKRKNQKEMKYFLMYIYDSKFFKRNMIHIDREMIIRGAKELNEEWQRACKEITEYVEQETN